MKFSLIAAWALVFTAGTITADAQTTPTQRRPGDTTGQANRQQRRPQGEQADPNAPATNYSYIHKHSLHSFIQRTEVNTAQQLVSRGRNTGRTVQTINCRPN